MRRTMVVIATLIGLSCGSALAAAQGATPAAGTASEGPLARTNVRYFLPYNAGGLNVGLAVVNRLTGTCDSPSSSAAGRPDAWTCIVEGGVLDPCFENPFGPVDGPTELACADSPFSGDVVLVTTTSPLPRTEGDLERAKTEIGQKVGLEAAPLPWALELANGEQCGILRGATAGLAGMRINYGCTGQGSVIGDVDESQPVWVVNYLPEDGIATELVEVTTAWI